MEKLASAAALIGKSRPERPVRGLRPHAAGRAARWFLEKFPGDVAYAYKANNSVFLIGALYGAGIRHFDVASLPEIEDAVTIPDAHLHFMHPVKSRHAIRRAYELGVRSFALDGEDELEKIKEAMMNFSEEKGMDVIQGSDMLATIRRYPKLSFPKKGDPRLPAFVETVKSIGLWNELAMIDVYELAKKINNKDIHPELSKILDKYIERGTRDMIYLRKK